MELGTKLLTTRPELGTVNALLPTRLTLLTGKSTAKYGPNTTVSKPYFLALQPNTGKSETHTNPNETIDGESTSVN